MVDRFVQDHDQKSSQIRKLKAIEAQLANFAGKEYALSKNDLDIFRKLYDIEPSITDIDEKDKQEEIKPNYTANNIKVLSERWANLSGDESQRKIGFLNQFIDQIFPNGQKGYFPLQFFQKLDDLDQIQAQNFLGANGGALKAAKSDQAMLAIYEAWSQPPHKKEDAQEDAAASPSEKRLSDAEEQEEAKEKKKRQQFDNSKKDLSRYIQVLVGDDKEIEEKILHYLNVTDSKKTFCRGLEDKDLKQKIRGFKKLFEEQGQEDKAKPTIEDKLLLLALLREAYCRSSGGRFAYTTQLLPLIYFMIKGNNAEQLPKIMSEISTGQGKSLISALLSATQAIEGKACH